MELVSTDAEDLGRPAQGSEADTGTALSSTPFPHPSAERAIELARRFSESLVADAVVTGRVREPTAADPAVDWQAIWASADGTASPERAAGRIVLAANRVAQTIAGTPEIVERSTTLHSGAQGAAPAPTAPASPPLPPAPSSSGPPPILSVATTSASPPPSRPLVTQRISSNPAPPRPPQAPAPSPERIPFAPSSPPPPAPPPPIIPAAENDSEPPEASGQADGGGRTRGDRRRRRRKKVFAWIRNIGAIIILFAVWQIWGTALLQHHSQTNLAHQFARDAARSPGDDRPFGLIPSTTRVTGPPQGAVIARLQIPVIGVDQFVTQGTTTEDLEAGPGHYVGTAVPGQAGNVVLAGHRTTFGAPFDRLDQLGPGDSIALTTTAGERLTYSVVRSPSVVAPSDVAILDDFGDDRVTLTTSTPKYSAAQRLVVVALLTQASSNAPGGAVVASTPPRAGPPPGPTTDTQTAGWNLRRLPFVVLMVALLVLLGLAYRPPSRGRRLVTVGVLGPIWIAGLYLLFLALTNVLPATL